MAKRSTSLHKKLVKKILTNPEGRAAYEAFKLQLELAEKLKEARHHAHLTQEKVAEKMGTQKPVIARLEAGGGKSRHSPSLLTLVKYANAIGYALEIDLVPALNRTHMLHHHRNTN